LLNDDLTTCGAYQNRYAISNNESQISTKAVGLIIDARSSEAGLDIPQTRHNFVPGFTSAPQPLQAKIKDASWSRLIPAEHPFLPIIPSI
jgi:hypothetical protein